MTVDGTAITDHGTIEVRGSSTFEDNASLTGGNLTVEGCHDADAGIKR